MIYNLAVAAMGFAPSTMKMSAPVSQVAASVVMAAPNAAPVYDGKYAAELRETAAAMVEKGKGLLACDESTGTVGTRLEANGASAPLELRASPHCRTLPPCL